MIRKNWDKYEVAMLIDTYLHTKDLPSSEKKQAYALLSQKLREIAQKSEFEIDDTFRNINGIIMRISNIQYLFTGKGLSSYSKLDKEMFNLYHKDKAEFDAILKEARTRNDIMHDKKTLQQEFFDSMAKKHDPHKCSAMIAALDTMQKYFTQIRKLKEPLFKIVNPSKIGYLINEVSGNKVFRFKYRKDYTLSMDGLKEYMTFLTTGTSTADRDPSTNELVSTEVEDKPHNGNLQKDTETSKTVASQVASLSDVLWVDWNNTPNLAHTSPIQLEYNGSVKELKSWASLLVKMCNKLTYRYPEVNLLEFRALQSVRTTSVSATPEGMIRPKILHNGYYIELNYSATSIIQIVRDLLIFFNVPFNQVKVSYYGNGANQSNAMIPTVKKESQESLIEKKRIEEYKRILMEHCPNGFRLDSYVNLKKFRKVYAELFGEEIFETDDELSKNLICLGLEYNGRVYVANTLIDDSLSSAMKNFIEVSFRDGASMVYFQALYDQFEAELLTTTKLYSVGMLAKYLEYAYPQFSFQATFLTNPSAKSADALNDVRKVMREVGRVITDEEVEKLIPYIPIKDVKWIFATNSEFISAGRNLRIHIDNVYLSNTNLNSIRCLIEDVIAVDGFISGEELIKKIKLQLPEIIDHNPELPELGLRNAISYKFANDFSFQSQIISSKDRELTMSHIFEGYCKKRDQVTLEELKSLRDEVGSGVIYLDTVYDMKVRVSEELFVDKKDISFDVAAVDRAIDQFCHRNYISLAEINIFSLFPGTEYKWNEYLLESFVYSLSKNYRLLHSNFNASACVGAIVKISSSISNFEELLTIALADSDIELTMDSALTFFKDAGYLARKSFSKCDSVLVNAAKLRGQKG